jgi:hypothetical protein
VVGVFDCSWRWKKQRTIARMATVLVIGESSMKSTSYEVLNVVNIAIVRKKKKIEH